MNYLGGKSRIAAQLVAAMSPWLRGRAFWDPFCGGLSMSRALAAHGPGLVSDVNQALITLYTEVRNGWQPPTSVSRETYRAARYLPDTDPLKAFCGFGVSFGGKWFGGYASNARGDDYTARARTAVISDVAALAGCTFACIDFLEVTPRPVERVIYLDPPYAGTTAYSAPAVGQFDHTRFYARVREWASYTDVFVSEYSMPFGDVVIELGAAVSVAGGQEPNTRVERLYHYGPS